MIVFILFYDDISITVVVVFVEDELEFVIRRQLPS